MSSIKKLSLLAIAITTSNVAMGGTMGAAAPMDQRGFYVGIGVGGKSFHLHNEELATYSALAGTVTGVENNNTDAGNIGVNGTLMAGYAITFPNRYFLGLEGFGNYAHISASNTMAADISGVISADMASTTTWTMDWAYGARALLGYKILPTSTTYAIVGYTGTRVNYDSGVGVVSIVGNGVAFSPYSKSNFFNGYQVGVGSMTNITNNLAVRADLIYSGFGSKTINQVESTAFVGAALDSNKIEPSSMEGNIGLVYMFS